MVSWVTAQSAADPILWGKRNSIERDATRGNSLLRVLQVGFMVCRRHLVEGKKMLGFVGI